MIWYRVLRKLGPAVAEGVVVTGDIIAGIEGIHQRHLPAGGMDTHIASAQIGATIVPRIATDIVDA